jgi:hypothetical protein
VIEDVPMNYSAPPTATATTAPRPISNAEAPPAKLPLEQVPDELRKDAIFQHCFTKVLDKMQLEGSYRYFNHIDRQVGSFPKAENRLDLQPCYLTHEPPSKQAQKVKQQFSD